MKQVNAKRIWDAIGYALCQASRRILEARSDEQRDSAQRDYECLADAEREFIAEHGILTQPGSHET